MVDLPNHFFKFIPPGFKFNLSIPKSFLSNLNGWKNKTAILKRGCHKWAVHITDGGVFGDGWRKFVIDNGVQELDFIVFKHQGNMVFDFFVFDQSTCEKQYPNLFDNVEEPLTESDTLHTHKMSKMVDKRKRTDYSSQSKDDGCCFETILTPYFIGTARLKVPMKFARSKGLITKRVHTEIALVDEAKRSWSATLRINTDQVRLTGLRQFIIENDLKAGDTCMFQLVKSGEKPVFNFYRKKPTHNHIQVQKKTSVTIKKETGSTRNFMSTLKPYSLKFSRLHLPAEFYMSNDLRIGEAILRDDEGRSWKVKLHKSGKTRLWLYLGCGFEDFLVANGLSEGDAYKLELVENENDKPPVLKFSILGKKLSSKRNKIKKTSSIIKKATGSSVKNRSSKFMRDEKQMEKGKFPIMNDLSLVKKPTHKHIQVKKKTNSTCFFTSTLKPYNFTKSSLYLPAKFSISNNLRKGEMILRDDKGRSWKVQLNKSSEDRFCVGSGLRDLLVANGLREGDMYKFELVENEKNKPPVVNFSLGIPSKAQETNSSRSTQSRIQCATKVDSPLSKIEDCPYYIGELKSYHLEKSILYLPSEFARKNGLSNKEEMILKNADERSWNVEIKSEMNKYCNVLRRGWKEFYLANGLKIGDRFKLEIVSNGEIPVANFYLQNS